MEKERKEEITERFVEAVEYLNRQLHTNGLGEWDGLDMTIPQIKTLVLLQRMGPLRMGNIAIFLSRALSATTTVVDRLVEKNLVDRVSDPEDRRVVICQLTDQGQKAVDRFWRIRQGHLQMIADVLDVEQLETVVQGLEFLRSADNEIQKTLAAMHTAD